MQKVTTDKDILDFLYYMYFGANDNKYKSASSRAYRDFNRTIRFNGLEQKHRDEIRQTVNQILEEEIKSLSVDNQIDFDRWHRELCYKVKEVYQTNNIVFTIGQAQKWINMMFKYLYIVGEENAIKHFRFLHVPIDNYIIKVIKRDMDEIKIPTEAWSRWNDYETQYMYLQNMIRDNIDIEPLRWEFKSWLKEVRSEN